MARKSCDDANSNCENYNQRIAFVGNTSFSLYNFRLGVMKSFVSKGYQVFAVAPMDQYSELFEKENITYIQLNIDGKGTSVINDMKLIHDIYNIYKSNNFNFIFHYTIKPVIYGSIVSRALKIPTIAVTTGLGYVFSMSNTLSRFVSFLYKNSLSKVLEIWFLNNDDRDVFVNYSIVKKEKTFVLNSEGVNSDFFYPENKKLNKEKFVFLLLSRLVKEKGIEEFVAAARKIRMKYPSIECQVLGKSDVGNPSNIPVERINEWHNAKYIHYFEAEIDVRKYISNSDCVVLPSYYREGVPRCLMEAMSMERPIITTNNVGCIELIDDNINGKICNSKDVEDLTDKMEEMFLLDENTREKFGANGRSKILESFDEKEIIYQYHEKFNFFNPC